MFTIVHKIFTQFILFLLFVKFTITIEIGQKIDLIFISELLSILFVPISPFRDRTIFSDPKFQIITKVKIIFPIWITIGISLIASLIFVPRSANLSRIAIINVHLIFFSFSIVRLALAEIGGSIFQNQIFAIQFGMWFFAIVIFSTFLLKPINRHVEDLLPIIQIFLHFNPIIAICQCLDLDIFRTPIFYKILPIADYAFAYPKWWALCGLHLAITLPIGFLALRSPKFAPISR